MHGAPSFIDLRSLRMSIIFIVIFKGGHKKEHYWREISRGVEGEMENGRGLQLFEPFKWGVMEKKKITGHKHYRKVMKTLLQKK